MIVKSFEDYLLQQDIIQDIDNKGDNRGYDELYDMYLKNISDIEISFNKSIHIDNILKVINKEDILQICPILHSLLDKDKSVVFLCVIVTLISLQEGNDDINTEIKSILEELRLNGVGAGVIKKIINVYKIIKELNKTTNNIYNTIVKYNLNLDSFIKYFYKNKNK